MIISNHQLTSEHFIELEALLQRCQKVDGHTIPIYNKQLLQWRSLPCNLLYYHEQQLVGFLSIFFFYDDACELTVMVDPRFRGQHIAAQMIASILPVIQVRGVGQVICSAPHGVNHEWLSSAGFVYQGSEFRMQWRQTTDLNGFIARDDIQFLAANDERFVADLVAMDVACFHSEKQEVEPTYQRLLKDKSYTLLLLGKQEKLMGKAHLHYESKQVVISDIAILPVYQGQGYAQALVRYCIQHVKSTCDLPLVLDVEADNENAVHIYKKLGFHIINHYERWSNSVQWFCRRNSRS